MQEAGTNIVYLVGESEKRETTVTITGLNPDQVYGVRVLAVNSNHYSAAGQLIRLRTRRKEEDLVLTHIQPVAREANDDDEQPGEQSVFNDRCQLL